MSRKHARKHWYTPRCHRRPLETGDTSLPLLTCNISLCFFFFYIYISIYIYKTVEDVLFKRYCLRSTVIPQARKTKTIHIPTCTHVYQLVYLLYFKKEKKKNKYWRLQVGCLQVRRCFMLRYFTEVLLFNTIMQFYLSFKPLFFVFFSGGVFRNQIV